MNRSLMALAFVLANGGVAAVAQPAAPLTPPGAGGNADNSPPAPAPDKGIAATPSTGVIHPGNPDPGMTIAPPAAGITPVVPPPGTAGNNPAVVPK